MSKMTVIQLLNKIANGEELPNKFKFGDDIFYKLSSKCYRCYETENIFEESFILGDLNEEIEIIEEDKKIRKIKVDYSPDIEEKIFYDDGDKPNHCILGDAGTELLIKKINEIIDKINGMEDNK